MFGLIDRNTKESRIRWVLKDRTKQKLLPNVKQYVYTCDLEDEDDTKTIKGLLPKIKKLSHDLSGINFNILNSLEKSVINIIDYFNDWICISLFSRNCENYGRFVWL